MAAGHVPGRGDRLGAGLPCYCSRLFSSGEAVGPAGCRQPGTAWPILNRLHKESAAPARIFSELYLSKRSAGREGGRAGGGGAAPGLLSCQQLTCSAVLWGEGAQPGCCVQHPGMGQPLNPPGSTEKLEVTGQSIKVCERQQIPVHRPSCGSQELSQGRQLCCARGLRQAATHMERPTGSQDKIPARPC